MSLRIIRLCRRVVIVLRDRVIGMPREKRLALAKRQYERELQAAGHTRAMARVLIAERFGRGGK